MLTTLASVLCLASNVPTLPFKFVAGTFSSAYNARRGPGQNIWVHSADGEFLFRPGSDDPIDHIDADDIQQITDHKIVVESNHRIYRYDLKTHRRTWLGIKGRLLIRHPGAPIDIVSGSRVLRLDDRFHLHPVFRWAKLKSNDVSFEIDDWDPQLGMLVQDNDMTYWAHLDGKSEKLPIRSRGEAVFCWDGHIAYVDDDDRVLWDWNPRTKRERKLAHLPDYRGTITFWRQRNLVAVDNFYVINLVGKHGVVAKSEELGSEPFQLDIIRNRLVVPCRGGPAYQLEMNR